MSAPTVLHPRRSMRWATVVMAVLALGLLGWNAGRYGLVTVQTLPALGVAVLLVGAAVWLVASTSPLLVLDDRGFHAPMLRRHETVGWRRVATIRLGTYPWGVRSLEVICWRDAADHSQGFGEHLQFPALMLPRKATTVVEEMQRRRSEATVE